MEIGDVLGERGEPGVIQPAARPVDEERGADLEDDAPERGKSSELTAASASCRGGFGVRLALRRSTASTARRTSGTPCPETAESTNGLRFAARFRRATCSFRVSAIERVGFRERDDFGLLGEAVAVGLELLADGAVGPAGMFARAVDEVEQHAAALDVAEEAVAEAGALVRALDQARDVGEHEFALGRPHDAEARLERRERIVGDLRLRRADGGEKGRLAGIRQADEPGIGDELQPQPEPALLALEARIGAARGAVGRGREMGVAEAAVAALGEADALAGSRSCRR